MHFSPFPFAILSDMNVIILMFILSQSFLKPLLTQYIYKCTYRHIVHTSIYIYRLRSKYIHLACLLECIRFHPLLLYPNIRILHSLKSQRSSSSFSSSSVSIGYLFFSCTLCFVSFFHKCTICEFFYVYKTCANQSIMNIILMTSLGND